MVAKAVVIEAGRREWGVGPSGERIVLGEGVPARGNESDFMKISGTHGNARVVWNRGLYVVLGFPWRWKIVDNRCPHQSR